jgi:hypothetical protein
MATKSRSGMWREHEQVDALQRIVYLLVVVVSSVSTEHEFKHFCLLRIICTIKDCIPTQTDVPMSSVNRRCFPFGVGNPLRHNTVAESGPA